MLYHSQDEMFQKDKLEDLLKIHNVSRDQILRDTLGKNPKEFANWKVKWSRLINKKEDDPHNFGLLELSELLTKYFNSRGNIHQTILANTHFITRDTKINGIGEIQKNGQVRVWSKKEIRKLIVVEKWKGFQFVLMRAGALAGCVRYFKPLVGIENDSLYGLSISREKKTKKLYVGYLDPKDNGNFDILDKSTITDKVVSTIAINVNIEASSRFAAANYPTDSQWR
nr:hypothetical protein [uncultured Mediterranean phage uvMED]